MLTARQDYGVLLDEIDPGTWLCLQTDEGHVAALASVGNPQVVFAYTVWR